MTTKLDFINRNFIYRAKHVSVLHLQSAVLSSVQYSLIIFKRLFAPTYLHCLKQDLMVNGIRKSLSQWYIIA